MPTEGAQFPSQLDPNNPSGAASAGEGDDQTRQLKTVFTETFVGNGVDDDWDQALTVGPAFLNSLATDVPDLSDNVMRKDVAGTVAVEHTFNIGMKIARGSNIQTDNDLQVIGAGAGGEVAVGSGLPVTIQDATGAPIVNDGVDASPILTRKYIANYIFPVGAIYFTAGNNNPSNQFPGTSWGLVSQGKFVVGVGTDSRDGVSRTYAAGEDTVGKYTHRLTESEMPPHTHSYGSGGVQAVTQNVSGVSVAGQLLTQTGSTGGASGVASKHENCPPAYALYCWRRNS